MNRLPAGGQGWLAQLPPIRAWRTRQPARLHRVIPITRPTAIPTAICSTCHSSVLVNFDGVFCVGRASTSNNSKHLTAQSLITYCMPLLYMGITASSRSSYLYSIYIKNHMDGVRLALLWPSRTPGSFPVQLGPFVIPSVHRTRGQNPDQWHIACASMRSPAESIGEALGGWVSRAHEVRERVGHSPTSAHEGS
jgi:hypothetical protein